MKAVSKNSRPAQAFFFLARVDNIKIKRNASIFSSNLLYSFYCSPFRIFSLLHGLVAPFRSCESKVHMSHLTQIIDTVFINPEIFTFPVIIRM